MLLQTLCGPITYADISDSISIAELEKFCLDIKNKDVGKINSNAGGYHSNDISHIDEIKQLKNKIMEVASFYKNTKEIESMWVNVNQYKDHNYIHNHMPSYLSGVVYLHSNYDENFGELVLVPPNEASLDTWISKQNPVRPKFKPYPGLLVIFPGWAEHFVEQNNTKKDRISIAFNIN